MAKLTEGEAYNIKYDFTGTSKVVAERYNCTVGMVESIRRREDWCHILDVTMENLFRKGELSYPRGATANLSKEDQGLLTEDLLSEQVVLKVKI